MSSMNSKEIWSLLENAEDKEIMIFISMSIQYLEKARNIEFKDIIKNIKNTRKCLNSHQ